MKEAILQSILTNQFLQAVALWVIYDIACKLAKPVGSLIKLIARKVLELWDKFWIYIDVKKAEKKFPAEKMGEQKKQFVLQRNQKRDQRLQKFDTSVDQQIEIFVGSMNAKKMTMKTTMKTEASELVTNTADSIKESVTETVKTALINNNK